VLAGTPASGETGLDGGRIAWSLQPVLTGDFTKWAVYVQIGEPRTVLGSLVQPFLLGLLAAIAVLTPVGAAFGMVTMRDVVERIQGLVAASRALAEGEFSRRVRPRGSDELTTLQRQFNATAARLEEAVDRLQALAADHARLAERERIARDFHDSISQELFSLRMTVGALEMDRGAGGALRDRLQEVGRSLTAVIRQMRVVLLELSPPAACGLDLRSALRQLVAAYHSRVGLAVEADVEPIELPDHVREGLLRVAQEALANAARHAGASRAQVCLRRADGEIVLRVADDGRGFEPTAPGARHGLGLRGMEERAAELGGVLRIDSGPGRGTAVVVRVPAR
jgi:signal transduction histidine kinase